MDGVDADLVRGLRKELGEGKPPGVAVNLAMKSADVDARVMAGILDGVQSASGAGLHIESFKDFWLSHEFSGAGSDLSGQLHKLSGDMRKVMVHEIRSQVKASKTWVQTAKAIDDLDLTSGDVAKVIDDLVRLAKKSYGGDAESVSEYRKQVKKAQRHVNSLAKDGAPTQRLKKAYQAVIAATEKGSAVAVDKALNNAVVSKARYNADRVARTEIAKAYEQKVLHSIAEDEDAIAYRWELSSRHKIYDICDFHSGADMFGLGAGTYPIGKGPRYPAHPHCSCVLSPAYRVSGDPSNKKHNPKAGQEYLAEHPKKRRQMLGKAGNERFEKNPKGWESDLQNYKGYEAKKLEIPPRYYEKGTT